MAARTNDGFPKVTLEREENENARQSMRSKLVPDPSDMASDTIEGKQATAVAGKQTIDRLSDRIAGDRLDTEAIFQMLPDLVLAKDILVGGVLSPRDLTRSEINITSEGETFNSELAAAILDRIIPRLKRDYKISEDLKDILEKILFYNGSYPVLVLPENTIDTLINGSIEVTNESFKNNVIDNDTSLQLGFLGYPSGNQNKVSMEGHSTPVQATGIMGANGKPFSKILVTDNFNILKKPMWLSRSRNARTRDILKRQSGVNASFESTEGMSEAELARLFAEHKKQQPNGGAESIQPQAYAVRKPEGQPLVLSLPPEAVIPICRPGDTKDKVGFFLLLDENGNPIRKKDARDYYSELQTSLGTTGSGNSTNEANSIIGEIKSAFGMTQGKSSTKEDLVTLTKLGETVVVNDLKNRLLNGVMNEETDIRFTQDAVGIMLWRAMKEKQTQILFVPPELMIYYSFDCDDFGIGRSLLYKTRTLASMRISLKYAHVIGQLRSLIPRKRGTLTIDDRDPDPNMTIELAQMRVLESAKQAVPFGYTDPGDVTSALLRMGFDWSYETNNPRFPTTRIQFEDYTRNETGTSVELSESLAEEHIAALGVPPELTKVNSADYAVSVVNKNMLFARTVSHYQKAFMCDHTDYIRRLCLFSPYIREMIETSLEENKTKLTPDQKNMGLDELAELFISTLVSELPSPDFSFGEDQLESFRKYVELLNMALEQAYLSPDLFPEDMLKSEHRANLNQVIAVVRAKFLREWLAKNNVAPELREMVAVDNNGRPVFDLLESQQGLFKTISDQISKYLDAAFPQQEQPAEPEQTEGGDDFGGDEGSGVEGDEGDDEFPGGDDSEGETFPEDGDTEETPEEEPEETEAPEESTDEDKEEEEETPESEEETDDEEKKDE